MNWVAVVSAMLCLSAAAPRPAAAAPAMESTYISFDVTNQTGMDAQDLELDFVEGGIVRNQSFSGQFGDARTNPPDNDSITFIDGTVKAGRDADGVVKFAQREKHTLALAAWTFSAAGVQPIVIPLPKVTLNGGKRTAMASPTGLDGFMTVTNDESSTVYFSNLTIAVDIPNADLDPSSPSFQDDLNIPDGTPVTEFPADFSLLPMQQVYFDLGPVNAADYEAMQFDLSFSAGPAVNGLGLASDAVLPEPNAFWLLLTALGTLGLTTNWPRPVSRPR
jgi:hypothetical protein